MAKPRRDAPTSVPHQPTISPGLALKRLQKLLDQIPEIRRSGHGSPTLPTWEGNVRIVLSELYGENSLVFKQFGRISFSPVMFYSGQPESDFVSSFNSGLDEAKGFLQSRISDLAERADEGSSSRAIPTLHAGAPGRKIFLVHGHDHGNKETVARFLAKLGLEPVILHEQPDQGRTIIEKFESHAAGADCAAVILTADDIGYSQAKPDEKEKRARQNVILELGFFVGSLGRERTFALVERGVTLPSDIHGVVYIPLDNGEWRLRLVRELKAAGFDVDANNAF
jgi:predicted nucleotide-binding protein